MITSHTLVRNGQPFISLVLRQVEPLIDKMFITISKKSSDRTLETVVRFEDEHPQKVKLLFEDVEVAGDLTKERQKQLDYTEDGSWVLFLDDDDYWPSISLGQIKRILNMDVDAFAISPIQLIDKKTQDISWNNRWFTKFFKKQKGVCYKHPWPKDLIYKDDEMLYWKKNKRVMRIEPKFIHLSYLKGQSFRKEQGFEKYNLKVGQIQEVGEVWKDDIEKIYECLR